MDSAYIAFGLLAAVIAVSTWVKFYMVPSKVEESTPPDPESLFEAETVPIDDPLNPTSVMYQLTVKVGPVFMNWDPETDEWVCQVNYSNNFRGKTKAEALYRAKSSLLRSA